MSGIFHPLMADGVLAEGESRGFVVNAWPILLCRHGGAYFAILNRCSHAEARLEGGRIRRGNIACPLHGTPFSLQTGICTAPVRYRTLRVFPTRIAAGEVEVAVPEQAPGELEAAV